MADIFRVALSGDFRKADGSPTFPDFDLAPLRGHPGIEVAFLEPGPEIKAEQLTVVAPRANVSPEAWSQLTAIGPSTMSLAEVAKVTLAPAGPVASAVWSVGRTRDGAVVS